MSSEPKDEVVEHAIQSALSSMSTTSIRPNKLRKIICKQLQDTNWTQYQRVLDRLVENKCVRLQVINGEKVIVSVSQTQQTGKSQSTIDANVETALKLGDGDGDNMTDIASIVPNRSRIIEREEIKVPFEIILHLTKKGRKKQKNIETNTKTKITFDNETNNAIRSNETVKGSSSSGTCTVIITKTYTINEEDGMDEKESKEKAQKQIQAAKLYITKMVQSFQNNPDHFIPPKAGGTFAEQEEAKKRKLEAARKNKKKTSSDGNDHKNQKKDLTMSDSTRRKLDDVDDDKNDTKTKKKVRRKYY